MRQELVLVEASAAMRRTAHRAHAVTEVAESRLGGLELGPHAERLSKSGRVEEETAVRPSSALSSDGDVASLMQNHEEDLAGSFGRRVAEA